MSATKHVLALVIGIALTLAGCGTYVPEIQEIPWNHDADKLVQAVASSIHCEVRNAINYIKDEDKKAESINHRLIADWLDTWGAQIDITLTIDEQSSVNPMGTYMPSTIFSLFGGANITSDATRVEVLNYYYTVAEIQKSGPCSDAVIVQNANHPLWSLLIQSDLKLKEWLSSVVEGRLTGDLPVPVYATDNKNARTPLHTT